MVDTPNSHGLSKAFGNEDAPMPLFKAWLEEAEITEINDANAFALATVDFTGQPSVRMLLLKGMNENGFVFYTNMHNIIFLILQKPNKVLIVTLKIH